MFLVPAIYRRVKKINKGPAQEKSHDCPCSLEQSTGLFLLFIKTRDHFHGEGKYCIFYTCTDTHKYRETGPHGMKWTHVLCTVVCTHATALLLGDTYLNSQQSPRKRNAGAGEARIPEGLLGFRGEACVGVDDLEDLSYSGFHGGYPFRDILLLPVAGFFILD